MSQEIDNDESVQPEVYAAFNFDHPSIPGKRVTMFALNRDYSVASYEEILGDPFSHTNPTKGIDNSDYIAMKLRSLEHYLMLYPEERQNYSAWRNEMLKLEGSIKLIFIASANTKEC